MKLYKTEYIIKVEDKYKQDILKLFEHIKYKWPQATDIIIFNKMSRELQYTIVSENENDYSKIHTCLEAPTTPITKLTITGLTTLCTIVVLDENDYIEIDRTKYYIKESYTNINSITLAGILTNLFKLIYLNKMTKQL